MFPNLITNNSLDNFIPYAKPSINEEDIDSSLSSFKGALITRGKKVEEFEKNIAHYCGVKYAVCFNSGTTALQAACFASQLSENDNLVTTPNTFVGTIVAGIQKKAIIQLIDIDVTTGNLDLGNLYNTRFTGKSIYIPVHFSGIPVDVEKLRKNVEGQNAIIIEDAAHALGSRDSRGNRIGSCSSSDMTILSFHPTKTITTGEGGAVTTNDSIFYERLRLFRNNGITYPKDKTAFYPGYYEVQEITGNYNFTEFQAALGISQLNRIEDFIKKRRCLVQRYRTNLKSSEFVTLFDSSYDQDSAHHLMVIQIDFNQCRISRSQLMHRFHQLKIGTQVHYIPLYRHPCLKKIGAPQLFPKMEQYYAKALTLPLFVDLDLEAVDYVCNMLLQAIE